MLLGTAAVLALGCPLTASAGTPAMFRTASPAASLIAHRAVQALPSPAAASSPGWKQSSADTWQYQKEDGTYVAGAFTPDGYFVDNNGVWKKEVQFMGMTLPNRNFFVTPNQAGSFLRWEDDMKSMMNVILRDLPGARGIELSEQEVGLYAISNNTGRELLSFYKYTDGECYVVSLKCPLNTTRVESQTTRIGSESSGSSGPSSSTRSTVSRSSTVNAAWYDYQVLIGLLSRVSRTGPILAEALYSSWMSTNFYGLERDKWVPVGDALIKYEAEDGEGLYYIKANPNLSY